MDIKYPVPCPLLTEALIDAGTCFDIHPVVEGTCPQRFAPEGIFQHEEYEAICNSCQYHRDD